MVASDADCLRALAQACRDYRESPKPEVPLDQCVKELTEEMEQMAYVAAGVDVPHDAFLKGVELLKLIPLLFEKIKHGEPGHEAWLKEAIECHFLGKPMSEYVVK